jgi:putative PIN family toxin of toxin-antitoxin system
MNPNLIVVDSNVLISAALNLNGTTGKVLKKVYKHFKIMQTNATYQELISRIYKSKFDKYLSLQDREDFLDTIYTNSLFIETRYKINDCRDQDDNKFLELALESKAQFLITGDKDLLELRNNENYEYLIITPREFLELDEFRQESS